MEVRDSHSSVTVETRDDGGKTITGYGAVFFNADDPGTEFELFAGLKERIAPGAFDRALAERDDVRGLFNHDRSAVLGRTESGTMRLTVDAKGLRYSIDVADTSLARDVVESIKRGDVSGSSFSFEVTDQEFSTVDEVDIRVIQGVRLFDTGPVTFPAYEATTAAARSLDHDCEGLAAWRAWRLDRDHAKRRNAIAKAATARIVEINEESA